MNLRSLYFGAKNIMTSRSSWDISSSEIYISLSCVSRSKHDFVAVMMSQTVHYLREKIMPFEVFKELF